MEKTTELDLTRIAGIISEAQKSETKAVLLEREVGLDNIYALISMGEKLSTISSGLGLSVKELEFILKRTPEHSKRYMSAKLMKISDYSANRLDDFNLLSSLDDDQARASKHHSNIIDMNLKNLREITGDNEQKPIVVQNNFIVKHSEAPPLPEELEDIIDVSAES